MELDLADLKSIRRFADAVRAAYPALHGLCNNAGVMAIPYRKTADGFEMQFGTNHLGHFALTGLLLERLLATPGARVVSVSSNAHKFGAMHWDDPQRERGYSKWSAYGQSKLANLLFTYELQRRLAAVSAGLISVACHPGYAATNLQAAGPRMQGSSIGEAVMEFANRLFAQSAAMGALPTLYAATDAGRTWRRLHRAGRRGRAVGPPEESALERALARSRGAAPPVGDVGTPHRRALRGAALSPTVRWRGVALIAAAAAAIVAVAVVVMLSSLDAIVKNAIESHGSAMTQTAVQVGSVEVSLRDGMATLRNLTIANPPGFTAPYAFELGEITVHIAVSSVTSDPLVIKEIRIAAPRVTCELNSAGMSNVEVIRRAVEGKDHPAEPGRSPGSGRRTSGPSGGRRLIIETLALRDGEVYVDARAAGGPEQHEKLPGFELTDIGGKQGGATPAEVGRIVIIALARDVAVAVAATQLERWVGKELGGPAGNLIKQGGAEAIRKGLGDVLDRLLGQQP